MREGGIVTNGPDRAAIVTGGGSGIGRAVSLSLAALDTCVLAVDRNPEALEETLALAATLGLAAGKIVPFIADLLDADAPDRLVEACMAQFSRVDVLINNVGLGKAPTLLNTTDEDLDRYFAVNAKVSFRMCRSTIPAMIKTGGGSIVNTVSARTLTGFPGAAADAAAKSAIVGLTRQLAAEYGRNGIRVNAVAPGLTETPFTRERIQQGFFDRAIETVPMGRVGQPQEVANAVVFLSSDAASFISGQILAIDGGWSATHFWRSLTSSNSE
jgi:NAD(P)-dependent dehydrogenase (short-subunit alcohol dehydrogenase family)